MASKVLNRDKAMFLVLNAKTEEEQINVLEKIEGELDWLVQELGGNPKAYQLFPNSWEYILKHIGKNGYQEITSHTYWYEYIPQAIIDEAAVQILKRKKCKLAITDEYNSIVIANPSKKILDLFIMQNVLEK